MSMVKTVVNTVSARNKQFEHVSQFPESIHSTQLCISSLKAWVTNHQLQANNEKTETILLTTKTFLSHDPAPQSVNLGASGIRLDKHSCVSLDHTLFPAAYLRQQT